MRWLLMNIELMNYSYFIVLIEINPNLTTVIYIIKRVTNNAPAIQSCPQESQNDFI